VVVIGIDPGVNTGLAVYRDGQLVECHSPAPGIVRAIDLVRELVRLHPGRVLVAFEDSRLIGGIGGARRGSKADTARLQGAGSVKRDCAIWAEALGLMGVPYRQISPRDKGSKVDARGFALLTGWDAPTNQHSRDAAMVAYPYRNQNVLRGGIDLV